MDEFQSLNRDGAADNQEIKSRSLLRKGKSARSWALLLLAPLLSCFGCLFLSFAYFAPAGLWDQAQEIPVTGKLPTEAQPTITPEKLPDSAEGMDPLSGRDYREELENRLTACYISFHQFYLYEEMAVNEPAIFNSELWRDEVEGVIDAFHEDCSELGTLPSAPNVYSEVDQWLKLAADEVDMASESFTSAVSQQTSGFHRNDDMRRTMDHVGNFIEFAHNAETALNSVDERREV